MEYWNWIERGGISHSHLHHDSHFLLGKVTHKCTIIPCIICVCNKGLLIFQCKNHQSNLQVPPELHPTSCILHKGLPGVHYYFQVLLICRITQTYLRTWLIRHHLKWWQSHIFCKWKMCVCPKTLSCLLWTGWCPFVYQLHIYTSNPQSPYDIIQE